MDWIPLASKMTRAYE